MNFIKLNGLYNTKYYPDPWNYVEILFFEHYNYSIAVKIIDVEIQTASWNILVKKKLKKNQQHKNLNNTLVQMYISQNRSKSSFLLPFFFKKNIFFTHPEYVPIPES